MSELVKLYLLNSCKSNLLRTEGFNVCQLHDKLLYMSY